MAVVTRPVPTTRAMSTRAMEAAPKARYIRDQQITRSGHESLNVSLLSFTLSLVVIYSTIVRVKA